jgi:two-component system chemotaxis response regulator CheY
MTGRLRVLAVDDCLAIRTMLDALFTAAGCQFVCASSARQALRALRVFHPQVILTDYNMPGVDGLGFVALMRRDPRFKTTPIFVVSSEDDPEIRAAAERAGADGWFAKPIEPAALMAAVCHASATMGSSAA